MSQGLLSEIVGCLPFKLDILSLDEDGRLTNFEREKCKMAEIIQQSKVAKGGEKKNRKRRLTTTWMVSGPEVACAVSEFEACQDSIKAKQSKGPDVHHHEQVKGNAGFISKAG